MKPLLILLLGAGFLTLSEKSRSQIQAPETSAALLIKIKAANSALIDQQTATLKTLGEMGTEANQIRILSKRG